VLDRIVIFSNLSEFRQKFIGNGAVLEDEQAGAEVFGNAVDKGRLQDGRRKLWATSRDA